MIQKNKKLQEKEGIEMLDEDPVLHYEPQIG